MLVFVNICHHEFGDLALYNGTWPFIDSFGFIQRRPRFGLLLCSFGTMGIAIASFYHWKHAKIFNSTAGGSADPSLYFVGVWVQLPNITMKYDHAMEYRYHIMREYSLRDIWYRLSMLHPCINGSDWWSAAPRSAPVWPFDHFCWSGCRYEALHGIVWGTAALRSAPMIIHVLSWCEYRCPMADGCLWISSWLWEDLWSADLRSIGTSDFAALRSALILLIGLAEHLLCFIRNPR